MKALLYSDWCVIRATLLRVLGVCLIVTAPTMMSPANNTQQEPAIAVAAVVVMMVTFYACIGLFGADEQNGWEQARLALPTTAADVVRARYVFMALTALAAVGVGAAAGMLVQAVLGQTAGLQAHSNFAEVVASALGIALVALCYLALMAPAIFRVGMSKARLLFSLPFVLLAFLALAPMQGALSDMTRALEQLTERLGSPLPIFAAGAVLATAFYLVSMHASERLYSTREL